MIDESNMSSVSLSQSRTPTLVSCLGRPGFLPAVTLSYSRLRWGSLSSRWRFITKQRQNVWCSDGGANRFVFIVFLFLRDQSELQQRCLSAETKLL